MAPFIQEGDTVIVMPAPATLRVGDVILFRHREGGLMLHRITNKYAEAYRTRGDALMADDGIIARNAILGRAARIVNQPCLHLHFPLGFMLVQALRLRRWPRVLGLLKNISAAIPGLVRRARQEESLFHRGKISS